MWGCSNLPECRPREDLTGEHRCLYKTLSIDVNSHAVLLSSKLVSEIKVPLIYTPENSKEAKQRRCMCMSRGKTNKLLVSSISEAIDVYIPVIQLVPALKGRRQERHWRLVISTFLRSVIIEMLTSVW